MLPSDGDRLRCRDGHELWWLDHRYARVLNGQVQGTVAAALVDANGDGADLNVDVYVRQPDGEWVEVASVNSSIGIPGSLATWTDNDRLILARDTDDPAGRCAPRAARVDGRSVAGVRRVPTFWLSRTRLQSTRGGSGFASPGYQRPASAWIAQVTLGPTVRSS
jgi:hypothetical protein